MNDWAKIGKILRKTKMLTVFVAQIFLLHYTLKTLLFFEKGKTCSSGILLSPSSPTLIYKKKQKEAMIPNANPLQLIWINYYYYIINYIK